MYAIYLNSFHGLLILGDFSTNNLFKFSTPHYNNAIMMDMKMDFHLHFLHSLLKDNQAFKDAVKLLKLWLKHRQFDQVVKDIFN